jgi:hypothetical protein
MAQFVLLKCTFLATFEKLSMKMISLLLLLLLAPVNASPFTSDTVVSITTGVLERYHSTCVYLLHDTLQQGQCHEHLLDSLYMVAVCKHSGWRFCGHTGPTSLTFL